MGGTGGRIEPRRLPADLIEGLIYHLVGRIRIYQDTISQRVKSPRMTSVELLCGPAISPSNLLDELTVGLQRRKVDHGSSSRCVRVDTLSSRYWSQGNCQYGTPW